ncbi:Hsp33 family molecular chaperone HslO [Neptuniibacter sp. CAU 1671]|uniref:Hsp33 family molecular chaperone HslO n=1 Tax=Neptuniibacter sp. CAU 1671 TaxID=3032593 RepID=UPI0023D9EEAE|nr:Hsp33 family molecular chaperone HslO [Neptuniibacter sp. CAU 1671]MDF2182626.1 Hsp33 family molecular chaperone HslO [Neptuniibacter sp. CAU 1671]
MSNPDQIQRILFDNLDVRGVVAGLQQTCTDNFSNHNYPPRIRQILGEMLAAVSLLSSSLKFDGRLILQAQGAGQIRLLLAECTHQNNLRAIARFDDAPADDSAFSDLLQEGQLILTLEPEKGNRYQGVVPLEADTLSGCLEAYFAASEQLPTQVHLACDGERAAGFMLQVLPAAGTGAEDWSHISQLGATLKSEELLQLDNETLLYRLFHQEACRLYEPEALRFRCTCSRERSAASLKMLDPDELHQLLAEQGEIAVDCQFCNAHYRFDATDIEALFSPDGTTDSSGQLH